MDKNDPISQEQLGEIERYVLNEMPPDERAAFAARLAAHGHLKKFADEMELLLLGVQEAALQEKLDAFHEGLGAKSGSRNQNRPRKTPLRVWLLAAAVIGILVVSAALLLFRANTSERLFAQYYKPDAGLVTAMGAGGDYAFNRAMVDYKSGQYAAAIRSWEALLGKEPANDTLQYFLGSAHLAAGHTAKSISYLENVSTGSAFAKDAQWYMGLALLKQGEKEAAATAIRQSNHPQKDALLARLNQ